MPIAVRIFCKTLCLVWGALHIPDLSEHNYTSTIRYNKQTNKITSWSRVIPEKLTVSQLVQKFTAFYGTQRFITAFKSAWHLSLLRGRAIPSMPSIPLYNIRFNFILPYVSRSSKWLLSTRFPHQNSVSISPVSHICYIPNYPIFCICSSEWCLASTTEHKALRYVVFSITLWPHFRYIQHPVRVILKDMLFGSLDRATEWCEI